MCCNYARFLIYHNTTAAGKSKFRHKTKQSKPFKKEKKKNLEKQKRSPQKDSQEQKKKKELWSDH